MDLSFYPLTLEAIDQADAEALCLFVGEDERPLTGLAGLVDWRLSGSLSRMIRTGILTGVAGEALLTTPGDRLSFKKLFLFGLGKGDAEGELSARVGDALRRLSQAGVRDAALQLPARLPPEVGVRRLVDEAEAPSRALVFSPEPGRLVAALSPEVGRGQAQVERRVVRVPPPPKAASLARPLQPAQRKASAQLPRASPLPFAPEEASPGAPAGMPAASEAKGDPPDGTVPSGAEPPSRALPPTQRYVPPPPKEQGDKKKRR